MKSEPGPPQGFFLLKRTSTPVSHWGWLDCSRCCITEAEWNRIKWHICLDAQANCRYDLNTAENNRKNYFNYQLLIPDDDGHQPGIQPGQMFLQALSIFIYSKTSLITQEGDLFSQLLSCAHLLSVGIWNSLAVLIPLPTLSFKANSEVPSLPLFRGLNEAGLIARRRKHGSPHQPWAGGETLSNK